MSAQEQQDTDLFRKIRGLLRQAQSTPYEQEAIAFLEKAQNMMLANATSEEEIWRVEPDTRPKPTVSTIDIRSKEVGSQFKRLILNSCAHSNRCRMWYQGNVCSIAGFSNDVLYVEMLYTSILVQMNMYLATSMVRDKVFGQKVKTYRQNFMEAYAERIGDKFYEMERAQTSGPSTGKELVLHRSALVDKFVDSLGLRLRTKSTRRSNTYDPKAQGAGERAADSTDISGGKGQLNTRRALNR